MLVEYWLMMDSAMALWHNHLPLLRFSHIVGVAGFEPCR